MPLAGFIIANPVCENLIIIYKFILGGNNMKRAAAIWSQRLNLQEKIAYVISLFCAALVILFSVLEIIGIWEVTGIIRELLIGMLMTSLGIVQWRLNKPVAVFSFVVAIFIFGIVVFTCF